ncbi:MAG: ATP-binding protein [Elainellaceae cyanobacterium]
MSGLLVSRSSYLISLSGTTYQCFQRSRTTFNWGYPLITGANLEELVAAVIETLNPIEQEVQNQEGCWYILRILPYRTTDARGQGAVVALVDIDSLKQAEQSLRHSQEQLEIELSAINQVQTLSADLFDSFDLDRALSAVLDTAIALHQTDMGIIQLYDPQREVLKIMAHRGFGPEFLGHFQHVKLDDGSLSARALVSGQRIVVDDVPTDPDYQAYRSIAAAAGFQSLQLTPLLNRQGERLGVLSTYFRQSHCPSERELRMLDLYGRQASEFINLIRVERSQQTLEERERVARAENASKDEFLSVLSHELRTPLTSILGWIQLMAEGNLDAAEQQQAIASIYESTSTQAQLIEELLDVSRIIQDRFQVTLQPTDLNAILQKTITRLKPQMQQKGIQLESIPNAGLDPLMLDSTRIGQVFSNLLSNATKFTPSGGSITVRTMDTPAQVQVQVSDDGKGISSALLPHIFEQFYQADSSNTRREGGLGLGLFLTRSITEAHGGSVAVESGGKGQGASFTVTLPKDTVEVVLPVPPPEVVEPPLDGIRVLLVEDDEATLTVIAFALRQFGASVTTARSAAEALGCIVQPPFDVLVSDVGLPDMNGYELMRHIRALPPEQVGRLPAIALTGYADQQSTTAALNAGFQAHLSKPADIEELRSLVYQVHVGA